MDNGGFLKEEEKGFKTFYKRSLWWVEHRALLRRIVIIVLAAFDAALLLFSAWTFLDTFVVSVDREDRAVAEVAVVGQMDLRNFSTAQSADAMSVSEMQVLTTGDKRYDFYTTLANANRDWYAEFQYAFVIGDTETDEFSGFILPGEEKPLAYFAWEADSRPTGVRLDIRDLAWHRVDPHAIADYDTWEADRLGWNITAPLFSRELAIDKEEIGRISFTVSNTTAFSYWEPVFYVLLLRGNSVAGVTSTTIDRFESGDTRSMVINWFGTIPAVTKIEVIPAVNLFDPDAYMPLEGETATDIRERVLRGRR